MKILIYTLSLIIIIHCTFNIENCMSQWEPDVRLTNNSNDSRTSFTPFNNALCIAASGSVVHIVWIDHRDGNNELYYKRSTDEGVSWGIDTRLTNDTAYSIEPSVAVSGSVVHIVWRDYRDGNNEIYYKRSTDSGVSWGTDTRLTFNTAFSRFPSVAVSGSVVYVVCDDNRDGNYEIYYKRSTDGGASWGIDTKLTNGTAGSFNPSVAVSGSVVLVVWTDDRDGNFEIYNKRSTDEGVSWRVDTRLTNISGLSSPSSVAVSGSVVHIVSSEFREEKDAVVYYKRSTDGGASWGIDTKLTNGTADSFNPSVAVSGSVVLVVWFDTRDGNNEIYYKHSTDEGVNWEIDTRLTNNSASSQFPSIAVSGSVVHVVWTDYRDGNPEIYYKRDPTGNPTERQNILTDIYLEIFENAQKAYNDGNYLLVIDLLNDFPIDNAKYNDAILLMNNAIANLPNNINQTFVTVSGIINCGCSKAIAGYVVFEDINTKLSVGKCRITSNGYYCIVLPSGKKYSYYIDSKDFYPLSKVIDFTSPAQALNYKDDITLVSYEDMKEQQVSVRINNIFFDFNESNLKSESYLELDRLYKFLNENSDISVEISGHTDNIGTDEYNITLSYARANAVKDYLILKGINSSRIITKGYGKSKPVAANETDEGRQLNRRVEFKILKK